jgi:phage terminase small subunit
MPSKELNPKQKRFVDEYLVDLNATQAYIRAGYSAKTADVAGPRLLGDVRVQAAIKQRQEDRTKRTEITQDRVLLELARIAFADIGELFDEAGGLRAVQDLTEEQTRAIASFSMDRLGDIDKIQFKMHDKLSALEKIGKHLGMFVDRTRVEGPNGGPVQVEDAAAARIASILATAQKRGA